jgi:hypothetical protein
LLSFHPLDSSYGRRVNQAEPLHHSTYMELQQIQQGIRMQLAHIQVLLD